MLTSSVGGAAGKMLHVEGAIATHIHTQNTIFIYGHDDVPISTTLPLSVRRIAGDGRCLSKQLRPQLCSHSQCWMRRHCSQ